MTTFLSVSAVVFVSLAVTWTASAVRDVPYVSPLCSILRPQPSFGATEGTYPRNSFGAPVFTFLQPPPVDEIPSDGWEEFNRTKHLMPKIIMRRSPFQEEPPKNQVLVGYLNERGEIVPTPPPTRPPPTARPTRVQSTRRPTSESAKTSAPTRPPNTAPVTSRSPTTPPNTAPVTTTTKSPTKAPAVIVTTRSPTRAPAVTKTPTRSTSRPTTKRPTSAPLPLSGGRRLDDVRRRLNIFLPDTRQDVDETTWPYRMVGKWRGCTATLILANGVIVTNAHCMTYTDKGDVHPDMWTTSFYAGFQNNNWLESSKPKAIWIDTSADYAIMKLWSPLNAKLGSMGVIWRDRSHFVWDRGMNMISYSGDHCPSWSNCRQKISTGSTRSIARDINAIRHDLDSTRGSSGSVMWAWRDGKPVVELLNFGEDRNGGEKSLMFDGYTHWNPNFARVASEFADGYVQVKDE